jgi:hypothetical protein
LDVKHLLKRGALVAAANWPTVAIQFAARTTFQLLLGVPIISAAVLVAVLLGIDTTDLFRAGIREMAAAIAESLASEPVALTAFLAAFGVVLLGGSVFMFLVKGGTVSVLLAAEEAAGPIESGPFDLQRLHDASGFTLSRFTDGCRRLFRRYLWLGLALMVVYGVSAAGYLAFVVYGYRSAEGQAWLVGWTLVAALGAVLLVAWFTAVNLFYLLLQIAIAVDDASVSGALGSVSRFARDEPRRLGGVFLVVFAMIVAATLVSALAWSGIALVAFVPLVGLVVIPLQIAGLLLRGLLFEYIGQTGLTAYLALYRRHAARTAGAAERPRGLNRDADEIEALG